MKEARRYIIDRDYYSSIMEVPLTLFSFLQNLTATITATAGFEGLASFIKY